MEQLAKDILKYVGGIQNIQFLRHCMTRLRFDLKNNDLVDKEAINRLKGVSGTRFDGSQFQVIIGTDVGKVYNEMKKLSGDDILQSSNKETRGIKSKNILTSLINVFSDVFVPILPAIIAAGMLKGVLSVLDVFGYISLESSTYKVFAAIGNGAFYFIPILIAISASMRFGLNTYVGTAIAATVLLPEFTSYLSEAQAQNLTLSFLGLPVTPASYASQVIPMFIMIWLAAYIEKGCKKIIPKTLSIILVPTLVLFISVPLFLVVIGPFGTFLSGGVTIGINFLFEHGGVLAGLIFGALMSFFIITGTQHVLVPVLLDNIANGGGDYMLPMFATNNIAQGAAALAVTWLVKDKMLKSTSISTGITGIFGVTEPAMYGINLRFKKPFIAGVIGSSIAGGFMMFFDVKAYAYVKSGLQGIPMLIGDTFIYGLIGFGIALFGTIIITLLLGINSKEIVDSKDIQSEEAKRQLAVSTAVESVQIKSPLVGDILPLSEVNDETFSSGLLGNGVAINPKEGSVFSPVDGVISAFLPTKHAVGIKSIDGVEILVHVGLNTVELNGKHFTSYVELGDEVKEGDRLIDFDITSIKNEGYELITPVVITNTLEFKEVNPNLASHNDIVLNVKLI